MGKDLAAAFSSAKLVFEEVGPGQLLPDWKVVG